MRKQNFNPLLKMSIESGKKRVPMGIKHAVPYVTPEDQALAILDEQKFVPIVFGILKLIAKNAERQKGTAMPTDGALQQSAAQQYKDLLDPEKGEGSQIALRDHIQENASEIETIFGKNISTLIAGFEQARAVLVLRADTRESVAIAMGPEMLPKDSQAEKIFNEDGVLVTKEQIARERDAGLRGNRTTPSKIHKLMLDPKASDRIKLSDELATKLAAEYVISTRAQAEDHKPKDLIVSQPIQGAAKLMYAMATESKTPIHTLMKAWKEYKIPMSFILEDLVDTHDGRSKATICAIVDEDGDTLKTTDSALYYRALQSLVNGKEKYVGFVLQALAEDNPATAKTDAILRILETIESEFAGVAVYVRKIVDLHLPAMPVSAMRAKWQLLYLKTFSEDATENKQDRGSATSRMLEDMDSGIKTMLPQDEVIPKPGKRRLGGLLAGITPPDPVLGREKTGYADNVCSAVLKVLELPDSGTGDASSHEKALTFLATHQAVLRKAALSSWADLWEYLKDGGHEELLRMATQKGIRESA